MGGEAATGPAAPVAERSNATLLAEYTDLLAGAPGSGAAPRPCAGRSRRSAWCGGEGAPGRRPNQEDVDEAWRDELAAVDPGRLVLVDGTGIDTRMTRAAGRGPGPAGAPGAADRILGALAPYGPIAGRSVPAATGTAVFPAFVEQALVPALRARPDALVVADDLAAREAEAGRRTAPGRPAATCRPTRPT